MLNEKAALKPIRPYKKYLSPSTPDKDFRQNFSTLDCTKQTLSKMRPSASAEDKLLKMIPLSNSNSNEHEHEHEHEHEQEQEQEQEHELQEKKSLESNQSYSFQTWWNSQKALYPSMDYPLHIEIGCGQGLHPVRWAQSHPNAGLVAIERTRGKFSKLISRLESHGITSVLPVNQDASHWLPHNLGLNSVDRFYFFYPNPYPKESQANKRWHRNPFFEYILECLKVSGSIEMASNLPWYIEEAKLYCQQHWGLKLVSEQRLSLCNEYKPQTHFEKKYLLKGEPCTHLIFQKN